MRPIPGPYIEERRRLRHQRPRYDVSRLGVLGELVEFIYDVLLLKFKLEEVPHHSPVVISFGSKNIFSEQNYSGITRKTKATT